MPTYEWEQGDEVIVPGFGMYDNYDSTAGVQVGILARDGTMFKRIESCKGYVQDTLYQWFNRKSDAGYPHPLGNDATRLLFAGGNQPGYDVQNALKFINEIEQEMGVLRSILKPIQGKKNVWYLRGSIIWLRSPVLISVYITLFRAGWKYEGGGWRAYLRRGTSLHTTDSQYLSTNAVRNIETIIATKGRVFPLNRREGWKIATVSYPSTHNTGISAFSTGQHTPPMLGEKALQRLGVKVVKKTEYGRNVPVLELVSPT